jgi:glucokinase
MGPGTGLGAAQLFWDTGLGAYKVVPGEGAHATFAPRWALVLTCKSVQDLLLLEVWDRT